MTHQARRRLVGFVLSGAIAIAMALLADAAGVFDGLESNALDARFELRGTQSVSKEVALVGIDDDTFQELKLQWPFPRRYHARVVDRLREAGAKVIAYDVQFSQPSADHKADLRLVRAAADMPRSVWAATETDAKGNGNALFGYLPDTGAHAGSTNFVQDAGGFVRRMPIAVEGLTSFAVEAAKLYRGSKGLAKPPDERPWIDYAGPPGTVPVYPFWKVLSGDFPDNAFRGKIVVVGATAATLHDFHPVSSLRDHPMPGPELNADAIATVLRGYPLREVSNWTKGLLLVVMGVLVPLVAYLRGSRTAALTFVLAFGAFLGAAQLAFLNDRIWPIVMPLQALTISAFGVAIVQAVTNGIERERVRQTFQRFVGDSVVDDALSRSEGQRLGGVETLSTALFLDVRGFTTFSESHPAPMVLDVLNHFLTAMSEAVLDAEGTLTAYLGDGLMAIFGAPIPQADHADRALTAASEMIQRLPEFNRWLAEQGEPMPLDIGIGVHSGPLMSGMVGSERRLEYTAIGDTVNSASRLEGLTKNSGDRVYLSEETVHALLREPPGELVEIGPREIRGRVAPMVVWALRPLGQADGVADAQGGGGARARVDSEQRSMLPREMP
jgi:adenylate cyclase